METELRLQIDLFCVLLLAVLWLSGDKRKSRRAMADMGAFRALMASTATMLVLDALGWLLDGAPGLWGRASVTAIDVLYCAFHAVPAVAFFVYADFQIGRDASRSRRLVRPLFAIVAASAILAALSPFFNIYFVIDADNRYHRGSLYAIFAAVQYGLVVCALVQVLRNRRKLSHRVFATLLAYPLPMMVAAAAQNLAYGLVLLWPMMSLFILVAWCNIENKRARTDYLTGTANRRSLDEELERRVLAAQSGQGLCGLLIDIDDFKKINDRYGHEAGDRALEDVASILIASVRPDDMVARMGGDEFVILVDLEDSATPEDLVRRIEATVENRNASQDRPYSISLSIGRMRYSPDSGQSAAEFLSSLDADMYARKKDKKIA
jgi:diguanylate cyclase (GGDEF) domain